MFLEEVLQIWSPRAVAVLRIVTGFLFLQHGSMKLLGFRTMHSKPLHRSPRWRVSPVCSSCQGGA